MRKIVFNGCFGGFSLSAEAVKLARKLSNDPKWGDCVLEGEKYSNGSICEPIMNSYHPEVDRHDPILVQVVETLGKNANGECANLMIDTINDHEKYRIHEYDGNETIYIQGKDPFDWH